MKIPQQAYAGEFKELAGKRIRSGHPAHLFVDRRRLAVSDIVLDLFNREVVGWSLKPRITLGSSGYTFAACAEHAGDQR